MWLFTELWKKGLIFSEDLFYFNTGIFIQLIRLKAVD